MAVFAGACYQVGGSILLIEAFSKHSSAERIAVVKLGGYKSMDENFGSF